MPVLTSVVVHAQMSPESFKPQVEHQTADRCFMLSFDGWTTVFLTRRQLGQLLNAVHAALTENVINEAISEAGAATVVCSFNHADLDDGQPCPCCDLIPDKQYRQQLTNEDEQRARNAS